jgi:ABC-2 type transport system ATP-binding protein
MSLVDTHGLTKRYRQVTALDDCTLSVLRGEVFGLLGPNGAGKTTLLRLLLGFLQPTEGHATVDGLDCHRRSLQVRRRVSYLPGDVRLFGGMRGRDVLKFFAGVRGNGSFGRSLALAERLELDMTRRVAFMSTGMRQKLALAVALAPSVPLVVLDEPTTGLDPNARSDAMQLVRDARRAGRTVFFSSHVLSEVEEVCDRVAILRNGRLVHTQVMSELRRQHRIRARLSGPLPPVPQALSDSLSITENENGNVTIDTADELAPLLNWLATLPLKQVNIEPVGLRVVYDRHQHPEADDDEEQSQNATEPTRKNSPP